jgi:DNA-binding NarL/FixJ family response regulator
MDVLVELLIGKLVTDARFRRRFEADPRTCLKHLGDVGIDLTQAEREAFIESAAVWSSVAAHLDPRLRQSVSAAPTRRLAPMLTPHEQRVLRGVLDGLTNREIAERLDLSEAAVKAALQNIFRKAGVRTRTGLMRISLERWAIGVASETAE